MKVDRALGCAVAALGLSVTMSGYAQADQIWTGYAPRCQTSELTSEARDPCSAQVATFGLAGPTVLSRNDGIEVDTTGCIDVDARRGARDRARSPL